MRRGSQRVANVTPIPYWEDRVMQEVGNMDTKAPRRMRRPLAVLATAAMFSGILVITSQPSGAVATTKTLNAACVGADTKTASTLAAFGAVTAPIKVVTEAPASLEPGQGDVPVSMTWSLSLDKSLVNTVAAISPSLTVSGAQVDTIVEGPTSTTLISGRPASQTIKLTAGQALNAAFPVINGTLKDIGNGGVIKLKSNEIRFTITLTQGPLKDPLNLKCTTGTTIASIPIKIAGSPDIVQPIAVTGAAGQDVTVDVLSKYVTNGKTKDGVEQQVDPSTLKVIEGSGKIVNGKLVATSPAAGASSDVTFEVCAGTIELEAANQGTSEVQEIRVFFDPTNQAGRRQLAARFGLNGEPATNVLWSARPLNPFATWPFGVKTGADGLLAGNLPADPPTPEGGTPRTTPWQYNENTFALGTSFAYPSAAAMQAALESVPAIGAGNVKVTRGDATPAGRIQYRAYTVEFTGAMANKSIDPLQVAKMYSFLPAEIKTLLLGLAGSVGGGGGTPKYPIPAGSNFADYTKQLDNEAGAALSRLDFATWTSKTQTRFGVIFENIGSLIDVNAATALLSEVFQPEPVVTTVTQGEDPTPAQTQELCSQGIVSVASASAENPGGGAGPGGDPAGGGGSGSGGNGAGNGGVSDAPLKFTG